MEEFDRKNHWEGIYTNKTMKEVSWYQEKPEISLQFIQDLDIPKNAAIIDIGGGDSFLVDHLLELEYRDITVLDVSENALERAQKRLGSKAGKIKWIAADAADFQPDRKYDFWHDRAAFHFLTQEKEIKNYIEALESGIAEQGKLVIGTFSTKGPLKCSGIPIQQYSAESLEDQIGQHFEKLHSQEVLHPTPFDTTQEFVFCSFERRAE